MSGSTTIRYKSKEEFPSSKKFQLESELQVFSHDKKLQELLNKIVKGKTSDTDWLNNGPNYLSRFHEIVRTRDEFEIFRKYVCSNTANEYLKDKKQKQRQYTS